MAAARPALQGQRTTDELAIVDPFWGPGFALVTATYVLVDGRFSARGLLALVLVSAWAARLGWHLWMRNRRSGEDPRYRAMRDRHGTRFGWVSLFTVFPGKRRVF